MSGKTHILSYLASRLVQTASDEPLLVAVGPEAAAERVVALEQAGCEVWRSESPDSAAMLTALCRDLGRRQLTNLMVEGSAGVLQAFFAAGFVVNGIEEPAFPAPEKQRAGVRWTDMPEIPPVMVVRMKLERQGES